MKDLGGTVSHNHLTRFSRVSVCNGSHELSACRVGIINHRAQGSAHNGTEPLRQTKRVDVGGKIKNILRRKARDACQICQIAAVFNFHSRLLKSNGLIPARIYQIDMNLDL